MPSHMNTSSKLVLVALLIFTASTNADRLLVSSDGIVCSYVPEVTSYDYDCPIPRQAGL